MIASCLLNGDISISPGAGRDCCLNTADDFIERFDGAKQDIKKLSEAILDVNPERCLTGAVR